MYRKYKCRECGQYASSKEYKLCTKCKVKKYRLYTIQLVHSTYDPSGSSNVTIWKIIPINKDKKLRCHHVYMEDYLYLEYPHEKPTKDEVKPIYNWQEVWDRCGYYVEDIKKRKFKGKLSRGIMSYTGNGIHAVVVDKKGDMYEVSGGWS